ncbi:SOS response-associated peptidase family protein [Luteolibacter yonseiensis]|uniref:Abasic site processing protein n=1 Tax=Luteolibacter yonseiensis TaxID=1144680 RepID=A0A934R744_9BACT|nr:SOS response-associated peptidase family protein [Luteolibacter yonseiensis]MBK1818247.1 SOS response-associated peptidase family protein [Luteolibacter yonseiensis]
MCTGYELNPRQLGKSLTQVDVRDVARLLSDAEIRIIRPTQIAPVIMPDGSLREMRWGIPTPVKSAVLGAEPRMKNVVNSREDKLKGWPWDEAFQKRRCIIPAAAFYEWVEVAAKKVPLRFVRQHPDTIWIAGIWQHHAEHGECYSMITTLPNAMMKLVHDRMPAVLTDEQIPPYLAGDLQDFGPSAAALTYTQAENFLKRKTLEQGELFE